MPINESVQIENESVVRDSFEERTHILQNQQYVGHIKLNKEQSYDKTKTEKFGDMDPEED